MVAALAGVASADVPAWIADCGKGSEASLRGEHDVPLDARIVVAGHGPFRLHGDDRILPELPLAETPLVEVELGPLRAQTDYILVDATSRRVAAFTTGSSFDFDAPAPPDASWSHERLAHLNVRDRRDTDVVAYIATLVGARARPSYLVRLGAGRTGYTSITRSCLAAAGVDVDHDACVELVAIDRAGNRSAPSRVCGRLAHGGAGTVALSIDVHVAPVIPPAVPRPTPTGASPWLILAAIVLTIIGWSRLRRLHATRRYRSASTVGADRAGASRALASLRALLLGFAGGCAASFVVAGAELDLTASPGAWLAIVLVGATVLAARAAWRVHAAACWLADPEGTALIDRGGYLFVSRGSDGPTYVPMRRATLADLAIELPAARVVAQ